MRVLVIAVLACAGSLTHWHALFGSNSEETAEYRRPSSATIPMLTRSIVRHPQ
jgi:hypothetical protein